MTTLLIAVVVALLAIVVAWRLLKGVIKTVALLAILIVVAFFVFHGGAH